MCDNAGIGVAVFFGLPQRPLAPQFSSDACLAVVAIDMHMYFIGSENCKRANTLSFIDVSQSNMAQTGCQRGRETPVHQCVALPPPVTLQLPGLGDPSQ